MSFGVTCARSDSSLRICAAPPTGRSTTRTIAILLIPERHPLRHSVEALRSEHPERCLAPHQLDGRNRSGKKRSSRWAIVSKNHSW